MAADIYNGRMIEPYLSVVIPCYNEQTNLEQGVLQDVHDYLAAQAFSSEVLVSDDGSSDGSVPFIQQFISDKPNFRLLQNQHLGKPAAVQAAVLQSAGQNVLFTDMDQSTPLTEFDKLQPYLEQGYDVVIGSRGTKRADAPWYRIMMAKGFLLLRRSMILPGIRDTQCGFKCFSRQSAHDLFGKLKFGDKEVTGWRVTAFDVELLFVSTLRNYRIQEVEVEWHHKSREGVEANLVKESWNMLKEIINVRRRHSSGYYRQFTQPPQEPQA